MSEPYSDLPSTRQGLNMYIMYAQNEIKKIERKIVKLRDCIGEAKNRLEVKEEADKKGA